MKPEDTSIKTPKPLEVTSHQQGVINLLREKQTDEFKLADWYLGALYALANVYNPERSAQAAHSLRELFEKLPWVLTGDRTGTRRERVSRCLEAADPQWTVLPVEARTASADSVFKLYKELEDFAHHCSLDGKRAFTDILGDLENVLLRLFAPTTAENQVEIQKLIQQGAAVTPAETQRLLTLITHRGANFTYFFKHVEHPCWLKPLKAAGLFRSPPRTIPVEKDRVSFPYWWPLEFLKRVAVTSPDEVVEIVIAANPTDNPMVLNGIVEIALKIPAVEKSIRLETTIRSMLKQPYRTFHPDLPKLIARWANGGWLAIQPTIRLCIDLIGFVPDPNEQEKIQKRAADSEDFFTTLEPRPKLDTWEFQEVLEQGVKVLSEAAPVDSAKMLIRLTSEMVRMRLHPERREGDVWPDYSEVWCKRVDAQYGSHLDGDEALVHALTFACAKVFEQGHEIQRQLVELNDLLRVERWRLFQRIRHHLYASYPQHSKEWMQEAILSYPNYADWEYRYEFQRMIRTACEHYTGNLFTESELSPIFNAILSGPNKENYKSFMGDQFTEERFGQRQRYFHLAQLRPFSAVLFGKYKATYDHLLAESATTPDDDGDAPFRSGEVKTGASRSPKSPAELATYSDDELVSFLNDWDDAHRDEKEWWIDVNFDGIGIALRELIKTDPARFLAWGNRWHSIERPIYLRYALNEAAERVKAGQHSELPCWLDLCDWVMAKGDGSIQGDQKPQEWSRTNPDWNSVRRGVVDFVEICISKEANIPVRWRDRLHKLVSAASCAPDPYLDRDEPIATPRDYLTDAINTARGRALENLISFGWWIRRHEGEKAQTPEVFEVLNVRFNNEPALTKPEHALLGSQLPRIFGLDSEWVKASRELIFPHQSLEKWKAAFSSYLRYTNPYAMLFPVMEPEFQFAMQHIGSWKQEEDERRDMVDALGQHIVMYYMWGLVKLDTYPNLLGAFYEKTKPKNWAALFDHVGRSINNSGPEMPQEIKQRCEAFFEYRIAAANSEELQEFTFWLEAECLDPEWRLKAYSRTLDIAKAGNRLSSVFVEALSNLLTAHPDLVVECFAKLSKQALGENYFYLQPEKAKPILRVGLASKNPKTVDAAKKAQENLLRAGNSEYLNLDDSK